MRHWTVAILLLVASCQQQTKVSEGSSSAPQLPKPSANPASKSQVRTPKLATETIAPETCGNGQLDDHESCDDGNRVGGDGCSPLCRKEVTGFLSGDAVDSAGRLHPLPGGFQVDAWDPGRVVRFEKFVAMLEGQPSRLAMSSRTIRIVPDEFADQVEHFAGMASTYVVALKNGEVWEVNAHLDPKTACKGRGLERPGILAADGPRWCRWPRKAKPVVELNLSSHVEEGGAVFTFGRTFKREPLPAAKHLADYGGTTCAVLETGEVACWGMNSYGQVGYVSREVAEAGEDPGYFVADDPPKTFLKFPTPVKKVSTGDTSYALTEGGQLWCWGNCYDLPFADTGEPQPYWHRMMADNPPKVGGTLKPIGASTLPGAPLMLPVECVAKDFLSSCVICEDGCLKCWHDKESLKTAECVTY